MRRVTGAWLLLGGLLGLLATPAWAKEEATQTAPSCGALSLQEAEALGALALSCASREYPNKPDLMLWGPEALKEPHENWPAFYGCYDWHSSVHGHWALLRLLKLWPALPQAKTIRELFAAHFAPEVMAREAAYFARPETKLFERPYGWAWFLRLRAELLTWNDPQGALWAKALEPLATVLSERTRDYLGRLSLPIRAGTHGNTAYSLAHMLDYARVAKDGALEAAIRSAAGRFYLKDRQCPLAYEPSGEDFISPCLAEADLLRRFAGGPQGETQWRLFLAEFDGLGGKGPSFGDWLGSFLPTADAPSFLALGAPLELRDPKDPRIGHLIGLAFQRAAVLRALARSLPPGDSRREVFSRLAETPCLAGQQQMRESGYGGEHWLASFLIFLRSGGGAARLGHGPKRLSAAAKRPKKTRQTDFALDR